MSSSTHVDSQDEAASPRSRRHRRRRHRRARRHRARSHETPERRYDTTTTDLESVLRSSQSPDPREVLRAWILLLDGFLRALERAAWDLRGLADEAFRAFDQARDGWGAVADELGGVSDDARSWKGKNARLVATGWMLGKVVASYRWLALRSAFLSRDAARRVTEATHAANARRFYETSIEQGGAFLKVGQLVSARPDLLPGPWIEELSKLQDKAKPVPFEEIRDVIERDFGASLDETFQQFDEEPVAAASIGQVHRAVTRDGREVAVKVKRPGVDEVVAIDLSLMDVFVDAMRSMLPPADYEVIVREVRAMVMEELDYASEAAAMHAMAERFEGVPGVRVPRPVDALCSENVLTSTFEHGTKITTWLDATVASDDSDARDARSDVLGRLLEVYLMQVLGEGTFQADPHPGNFLVAEDHTLILLDFGCTKRIDDDVRRGFGELMACFVRGDEAAMGAIFVRLGFETASGEPDTLHAFARILLKRFRDAASNGKVEWPTREEIFAEAEEVTEAARRDPVTRIPAEFVMIGRVFGLLGGLFQHYQPDIDWHRRVLPHVLASGAWNTDPA